MELNENTKTTVIFRKERFGGILFDSSNGNIEYYDEQAASQKLSSIKGERKIRIVENPFIENCYLSVPEELGIDITQKCNLKCRHCYKDSGKPAHAELTTSELFSIIDECEKLGVFYLFVSGGEATCREDLFDVVKYAKDNGVRAVLTTNGVYGREILDKIVAADFLSVRISLEGPKEINDEIRGEGSFEKAISSIKYLKEKGVTVSINNHICQLNKKSIERMVEIASRLGVTLKFATVRPMGRSLGSEATEMLSNKEFYAAVKKIMALKTKNPKIRITSDFDRLIERKPLAKRAGDENNRCFAAEKTMTFDSSGNAFPCSFLTPFSELNSGNIKNSKIIEIWKDSEVFKKIRLRKASSKCKSCGYFKEFCSGGCMAISYALTKNFEITDPLCPREILEAEDKK